MDAEMTPEELKRVMGQRLRELPQVVRDAINSADVEKHLRELADMHKLHLDQWQLLENEVMLTLLGAQEPEELADRLKADLGIDEALARTLAEDVSRVVFEPIRAELERQLGDQPVASSGEPGAVQNAEEAGSHTISQVTVPPATPLSAPVVPATPPSPPPEGSAVRAPISESYAARQPSHERKIIEGDPYREQVS